MRIGFFGSGNMVKAIALGIIKHYPQEKLFFYSPTGKSSKNLAELTNGVWVEEIQEMPLDLDLYVLGFKPQNLNDFKFEFKQDSNILSILAGTTITTLKTKFNKGVFIRVMPNTPSSVFQGMNLFYFENNFPIDSKTKVLDMFKTIGEVLVLNNESEIDLLTPFSGSGPGIIFEFASYLESSLKKLNIEGLDTRMIIAQTFLGSSQLMSQSNESIENLRDQVTSKKGVTFEALETMRKNKLDTIIDQSIQSAHKRIEEMKQGK